jgi:hypothetical protein
MARLKGGLAVATITLVMMFAACVGVVGGLEQPSAFCNTVHAQRPLFHGVGKRRRCAGGTLES